MTHVGARLSGAGVLESGRGPGARAIDLAALEKITRLIDHERAVGDFVRRVHAQSIGPRRAPARRTPCPPRPDAPWDHGTVPRLHTCCFAVMLKVPMHLRSLLFLTCLLWGTTGCGLLGTAAERRASLTVANHSNFPICSVQVAPPAQPRGRRVPDSFASLDGPDWGENLLGETPILPGYAHTVPVPAGRWDVRMDDCRGRPLYARRAVAIQGAVSLDFRPIRVERPARFSRRRVAGAPDRARGL